MATVHPPRLYHGDTVAIIATSGPCDPTKLANGVGVIQSLGLNTWVMESCHSMHGFLAGTDNLRLNDLHTAFAAPHVRGIFVARGGYGAQRLLPYINFDLIKRNPKVFVGYSDVTALHIAINRFTGMITYHGPMPAVDFGGEVIHPQTLDSLKNAIYRKPTYKDVGSGTLEAPLTGGNLTMLCASLGTKYELDTRGRILFIEEINEEPYRIDRMLLQLKYAGKLDAAVGIVLGSFAPYTIVDLKMSINEIIIPTGKPIWTGISAGHTSPNITLAMGGVVDSM